MKWWTRAAALLSGAMLVAGALTACDAGKSSHDPGSKSPSASASSLAVPQQLLAVGQSVSAGGVTTTVEQVVPHFGSDRPSFQPDEKTLEWLGVKARTCVSSHAKTQGPFGWFMFEAIDAGDGWYPALTWHDSSPLPSTEWPLPQYPLFAQLWAGQCAAGWVLIPVPRTGRIKEVTYSYAGARAGWTVP